MEKQIGDRSFIQSKIQTFLTEILEKQGKKTKLTKAQSLSEVGIVDSLFVIDLILFLEQEFNLDFSEQEISPLSIDTIDQIADLVKAQSAKA
ncbi:MAG: acyl carrier protein [Bdellovibrionales bacterium]